MTLCKEGRIQGPCSNFLPPCGVPHVSCLEYTQIINCSSTLPAGAPVLEVEPRDMTVRSGEDVTLQCQASGEPTPTIEWLRAGRPLQASRRMQTLPEGSLWLKHVEVEDTGAYECVAHNQLGSATARALLVVKGMGRPQEPCTAACSSCVWGTWSTLLPAHGSALCLIINSTWSSTEAVCTILRNCLLTLGDAESQRGLLAAPLGQTALAILALSLVCTLHKPAEQAVGRAAVLCTVSDPALDLCLACCLQGVKGHAQKGCPLLLSLPSWNSFSQSTSAGSRGPGKDSELILSEFSKSSPAQSFFCFLMVFECGVLAG